MARGEGRRVCGVSHTAGSRACVLGLLALALSALPAAAQTVSGRVVSEGGTPVAGAEVGLVDSAGAAVRQVVTDSAGSFLMRAPVPGTYRLRTTMLGFAEVTGEPLELDLATVLHLHVVMGREAVVLEPVTVVAESSLRIGRIAEFYDRAERNRRAGIGRIFTRTEIESGGFTEMRHIFLMAPVRGSCSQTLFINGMPGSWNELQGMNPEHVEGVEIYSSGFMVPPEYVGRVACGAAMVWTRNDLPGRPFSWRRTLVAGGTALLSLWAASRLMGR